jgi:general secretion pathway protein G
MFRSSRAFTIIELLTVIAIIGILSAIIIGVGRQAAETGRIARTKAELAAISTALESYKRQYGDYPRTNNSAELLQALVGKTDPNRNTLTPNGRVLLDLALFTTDVPGDPLTSNSLSLADPWEQPYLYAYKPPGITWTNSSFVLYSMGPDRLADSALASGGFPNRDLPANLDNIYATP